MRLVSAGDSAPINPAAVQDLLLRTSTLQPKAGGLALGWKQSPRGTVDGARPDDSTPVFAEMAPPGTSFEGDWQEKAFFNQPEIRRALRWQEWFDRGKIFEAANEYAAKLLSLHKQYAQWTRLDALAGTIEGLEAKLAGSARARRLHALARLGRRPAGQERMARHRKPGIPRDPAPPFALQQRAELEPPVPEDEADRVPE